MSYKIANNFPLDVYFLNDPSPTMKTLQASLKSLAASIGEFSYLLKKKWWPSYTYWLNTKNVLLYLKKNRYAVKRHKNVIISV